MEILCKLYLELANVMPDDCISAREYRLRAENAKLRAVLKAARKHIDPVIQYRLVDEIDALTHNVEG